MNWLKKIAQDLFGDPSRWKEGDLAILSSFSWRDFSVVEIVAWDQVSSLSSDYKNMGDTITTTRGYGYSWKRGDSVPVRILQTYSDTDSGKSRYIKEEDIMMVGPQNLYSTLEELVKKDSKAVYPDVTMRVIQMDHVEEFSKHFPQLAGNLSISDIVDYQIFDINGYEVQVLLDKFAMDRNPSILKTRGTEGVYYWYIPELGVRSFDNQDGIDKKPWGTGRFPTMHHAMDSAEHYLNYLFYGE